MNRAAPPRQPTQDTAVNALLAALLGWLIPGAGHFLIGYRSLAAILFGAITFAFGVGLALGGIKNSINPWSNGWLLAGEIGVGGYTAAGFLVNQLVLTDLPSESVPGVLSQSAKFRELPRERQELLLQKAGRYVSFYPGSDVAQIYLATAGLLNLLAIVDAIARAKTGLPTHVRRESESASPTVGGAAA